MNHVFKRTNKNYTIAKKKINVISYYRVTDNIRYYKYPFFTLVSTKNFDVLHVIYKSMCDLPNTLFTYKIVK